MAVIKLKSLHYTLLKFNFEYKSGPVPWTKKLSLPPQADKAATEPIEVKNNLRFMKNTFLKKIIGLFLKVNMKISWILRVVLMN